MSSTVGVIPARYLSTRFPGKPLVDIAGKPMIWRVYEQACKSELLQKVYVATDDERIYNAVVNKGGLAIMTDGMALNGTVRCFDAYHKIKEIEGEFDYLINIQGDEPFIKPEQISELAQLISGCDCSIATLAKEITDPADLFEDSVVKVVLNNYHKAMYFSRQAIPFLQGVDKNEWLTKRRYLKHIGIYAFKTSAIPEIKAMEPTDPEKAEALEQLRWLGYGFKISVGITQYQTISIDTPADLEKAILFAEQSNT
jgi:3-deoxy-manno-octulosonate cytidylyltransferase (CMP-KDO synthetase)